MEMTNIKLTVVCVTYNHAQYIRKALESFVTQKTNFPFEVIVHDDASTDGTQDIIREYEAKYPDIIKPIYQKENQWQKAKTMSKTFIYPKIQGKYVSFCEGDDYFCDENKLQKQVDFLESHPDYSICFHPVLVHWDDNRLADDYFPQEEMLKDISLNGLIKQNFIQTNSVVYRWRFHRDSPDLIPDNILPGDWFLHLLHAEIGRIGYIPQVMSVYRRNSGGMWTGAMISDNWFAKCALLHLRFYQEMEKRFKIDKSLEKKDMAYKAIFSFLRTKNFNKLQKLAEEYPEIYQSWLAEKNTAPDKNEISEKNYRFFGIPILKIKRKLNTKKYLLFGHITLFKIKNGN